MSSVAVHKFPWEVVGCTKDDVWNFAALLPSRTMEPRDTYGIIVVLSAPILLL